MSAVKVLAVSFPAGFTVLESISIKPNKVWINCPDGEGGEFCKEEYEKALMAGSLTGDMAGAISRFFWENF